MRALLHPSTNSKAWRWSGFRSWNTQSIHLTWFEFFGGFLYVCRISCNANVFVRTTSGLVFGVYLTKVSEPCLLGSRGSTYREQPNLPKILEREISSPYAAHLLSVRFTYHTKELSIVINQGDANVLAVSSWYEPRLGNSNLFHNTALPSCTIAYEV